MDCFVAFAPRNDGIPLLQLLDPPQRREQLIHSSAIVPMPPSTAAGMAPNNAAPARHCFELSRCHNRMRGLGIHAATAIGVRRAGVAGHRMGAQ
jgi:hypothetical protein